MAYKYLNDNGLKAYTKKVKGALKDLHTPIAISTENTTESMAQNVRNIADFVAKAKAAGIADVNGMAVTCLIDEDYSAVGYLYGTRFIGITLYDDNRLFYAFIGEDGTYNKDAIIVKDTTNQITSLMLTQGARKPIILTQETTEVDEETYQKLISDDVDVVFKDNSIICHLGEVFVDGIADDGVYLDLIFYNVGGTTDTTTPSDYRFITIIVSISKEAPHTVGVEFGNYSLENIFPLSPVLQEIDLSGTDAERKTKLDQFETDWKALTGASDLSGARFVGKTQDENTPPTKCVFTFDPNNNAYWGLSAGSEDDDIVRKIYVDCVEGTLYITTLFSHLSPMEILIDNSAASKQKNINNINAYKSNLAELGVDISNGYSVPVRITGNAQGYHGMLNIFTGVLLSGIVTDANENHYYPFNVSTADGAITFDANNYFLEKTSNEVTEMLDAIKYSYTSVPLTTTTSTNKTQLDLFLSKVPNAQVMHCTYKDVYAGTIHKINGSWYGVLVGESNTLAGQLSIKLQADGTIVEGTA